MRSSRISGGKKAVGIEQQAEVSQRGGRRLQGAHATFTLTCGTPYTESVAGNGENCCEGVFIFSIS